MTATPLAAPAVITRAGATPPSLAATDAVNGNTWLNDGSTWFEVTNTDSSTHTLTIHLAQLVDGQAAASFIKTLTAGATKRYAKFPVKAYGAKVLITVDSALIHAAVWREG
jgi:hypothetical protein